MVCLEIVLRLIFDRNQILSFVKIWAEKLRFSIWASFRQFLGWKDRSPMQARCIQHIFISSATHSHPPSKYTSRPSFYVKGETNSWAEENSETEIIPSLLAEMKKRDWASGANILGRAIEMVIKEPQQRRKNGIRPTLIEHEIQQILYL